MVAKVTVRRNFRGQSPEERQERRRRSLVEAALHLVHSDGLQATSVRSVCARAGLTSRYFYESFQNLEELLSAALEETADELLGAGVEAIRDAQDQAREVRLRKGMDASVGVLLRDPRRAALMAALGAGDPRLQRERRVMVMRVAAAIQSEPEAWEFGGIQATALYVAGGLVELTLAYLDGELALSRDQLVDHLVSLTLGAIGSADARALTGGSQRRAMPVLLQDRS